MNAQLKAPVETEEERLYRLYESPQALAHFKQYYKPERDDG